VVDQKCPACGNPDIREWMRAPDRFHGRSELYALARCQNCSLVWTDNPPRAGEMGTHYSADYDRLIAAAGESSPDYWAGPRSTVLKYQSGGRLLDLGCSTGSFLSAMKGNEWELYGIEMSRESARKAEASSGARIYVGDILDAPFDRNYFDVVTCLHVFEHLYEPQKILKKVWSWLRPGGIFYSVVPNIESAEARIYGSYWFGLELPRHLFHFCPASIRRLAAMNGFDAVSIATRRENFIEENLRYMFEDVLRKVGLKPTPLAEATEPSFPMKVVRKIARLGIYKPMSVLGFLAGEGEVIHFVLRCNANAAVGG